MNRNSESETELNRIMLFATNARFASSTQILKQQAVERIVEQVLESYTDALTIAQIQHDVANASAGFTIRRNDLEKALESVASKEQVKIGDVAAQTVYRLTPDKRQRVQQIQAEAERKINTIISTLYENSSLPYVEYKQPFLEALGKIFFQFGTRNAEIILGQETSVEKPFVPDVAREVLVKYPNISQEEFEKGVYDFFDSPDPDFNSLKWNLAQNYYVSVALGLDKGNQLLSKEIFENSTFYIDTNIAIAALEELHPIHRGFLSLQASCAELKIGLQICQISIDELHNWIASQEELLQNGVLDQIPPELAPQVDWLIYNIYTQKKQAIHESPDSAELLQSFQSVRQDLEVKYSIHVDDDEWFDNARNLPNIRRLTQTIRNAGRREKSFRIALHDALLIYWIHQVRSAWKRPKVWLLTADLTLPRDVPESDKSKPLTITLDALLQWISPVVEGGEALSGIFAEMIRSQILPQERFFKASDFRIMAYLQMQCKNLPPKDVADAITYMKHQAPNLDPTNAEDREKLTLHVQRFFSDPVREYQQNLEQYESALGQAKVEKDDLEIRYRRMLEEQNEKFARDVGERDQKILDARLELEELKNQMQKREQDDLRRQESIRRITQVVIGTIALAVILLVSVAVFSDGDNLWQKLSNSAELIVAIFTIYLIIAGAYLTQFGIVTLKRLVGLDV